MILPGQRTGYSLSSLSALGTDSAYPCANTGQSHGLSLRPRQQTLGCERQLQCLFVALDTHTSPGYMAKTNFASCLYLLLLWALISVLTWPTYVLCSTLLAFHGAEAWQLDAWHTLPQQQMFQYFIEGYKASAIVAVPLGFVAVVDYLLLSRYRATWLVGGVCLPVVCALLALGFFSQPYTMLPTLVATGFALAIAYRLIDFFAGRKRLGRYR